MNLSNEQLLQLLGQKEIDIYALKLQLQQLQQQYQELKDKQVKENNNGE